MLRRTRETMKSFRTRKNQIAYDRYRAALPPDALCAFCSLKPGDEQFISESTHFKVVRNRFPYDSWDAHKVAEHIMLVPKQHTDTLKDLSFIESKEYIEIISNYEFEGYNIYARTPGSNAKSVIHQHTHLIKFHPKGIASNTFSLKGKLAFRSK